MNVEKYLDAKNQALLTELRSEYDIHFESKKVPYAQVFTQNRRATIFFPSDKFSNESIAHELLHIKMRVYGFDIGIGLYTRFIDHPVFKRVFSKFLCDFVTNCFDHCKMFPIYRSMGYNSELFIVNANDEQCKVTDINSLGLVLGSVYYSEKIGKYIAYLVSIYAHHIKKDYEQHLRLLKEIEPDLFKIVTQFWSSWIEFDVENIHPLFNCDSDLIDKFVSDIKLWGESKQIE